MLTRPTVIPMRVIVARIRPLTKSKPLDNTDDDADADDGDADGGVGDR